MSATPAPAASDRSDFRTVVVGGTQVGLVTAATVALFLFVSRQVAAPLPRQALETLIVLAGGLVASFLPARLTEARHVEGIAGAAAIGLWGTIVFMAVDIIVLRPLKAYPWTWDAIGGGSTWWYLPIWWMLGTLLAWLGAIVSAAGDGRLGRIVGPPLAGTVVLAVVARLAGLGIALPVATGAGFTLSLAVLAVVALARRA